MKEILLGGCVILGVLLQSPLAAQEDWSYPEMGLKYEYEYVNGNNPIKEGLVINDRLILKVVDTVRIGNSNAFKIESSTYEQGVSRNIRSDFYCKKNDRIIIYSKYAIKDGDEDLSKYILYQIPIFDNDTLITKNFDYAGEGYILDTYKTYTVNTLTNTIRDTILNGFHLSNLKVYVVQSWSDQVKEGRKHENKYKLLFSDRFGIIKVFKGEADSEEYEPILELISVSFFND